MPTALDRATISGVIESCDERLTKKAQAKYAKGSLRTENGAVPFLIFPVLYSHIQKNLLVIGAAVTMTGVYSQGKDGDLVLAIKEVRQSK